MTMYDKTQDRYINWLYHVPGIGRKKMNCILAGEKEIKWLYHAREKELEDYFCRIYANAAIYEKTALKDAQKVREAQSSLCPAKLFEKLEKQQIEFLYRESAGYPRRLKNIPDAPVVLYRRGRKRDVESKKLTPHELELCKPALHEQVPCKTMLHEQVLCKPTVAVVGTRNCSEYGRYIAGNIGKICGEMGIAVVSGMASGIDGIAQWSALKSGSDVTAVLGCGVDICYPRENRELYKTLLQQGTLYSEYIPGTEPKAQNFPPRNRIISGLADAVIVVEAKEKSGTLITVDMALEQGKDVYVVPGRITDPMSAGCNRLVAQGAEMIVDVEKTLREICKTTGVKTIDAGANENYEIINGDEFTKTLLQVIDFAPRNVQQLYEKLAETGNTPDIRKLQHKLIQLEMEGVIAESGGGYLKRAPS